MTKPVDIADYLDSLTEPTVDIAARLRALLDAALPDADAKLWHGQPVWMAGKDPLAGFKAYTAHVTFMIWHGDPIADPTNRLTNGPHMATVKLLAAADVDDGVFAGWVQAAHGARAASATR